MKALLSIAASICVLPLASAQSRLPYTTRYFESEMPSRGFGTTSVVIGDVDGDGRQDLAVGAPGVRRSGQVGPVFGAVYVYSGATLGLIQLVVSTQSDDGFGSSLCGVGDVDGDHRDDFVVGAPRYDWGSAADVGAIFLYRGLASSASLVGGGNAAGDQFGASMAFLGDTDGDGRVEIVVGSPFEDVPGAVDIGKIHKYRIDRSPWNFAFLSAGGGNFAGDQFATQLLAADIDGDGDKDLVVTSPMGDLAIGDNRGQVHVYFTGGGARHHAGQVVNERFGTAVVSGDFNADGSDDLLVGSPGYTPGNGRVTMISGSTSGVIWTQIGSFRLLGEHVNALGDVNGDAVADFLLGGFHRGSSASFEFQIFLGGRGGPIATSYYLSGTTQIWYVEPGRISTGAWDRDGDGLGEPFIASWSDSGTQSLTTRGVVYVYDHPTTGSIPAVSGMRATVGFCGRTEVNWNALGTLVGYELQRDGVPVATIGPATRRFVDSNPPAGPRSYTVRGVAAGRFGAFSSSVSGEAYRCFELLGGGCPGVQGIPLLTGVVEPVYGGTMQARLTKIGSSAVGVWFLGVSDTDWGGNRLPMDLSGFGFPGCVLVVSLDMAFGVGSHAGQQVFAWRVPGDPALMGVRYYLQAANQDPSRIGGVAFSNGLRLRIGRPPTSW